MKKTYRKEGNLSIVCSKNPKTHDLGYKIPKQQAKRLNYGRRIRETLGDLSKKKEAGMKINEMKKRKE